MRPSIVLTIFRKELRETLRDRRTLVMMIGLPIVLYPILLIGLGKLQEAQEEATEARTSVVAVWGDPPRALTDRLRASASVDLRPDVGLDTALASALKAGRLALPRPVPSSADEGRPSRRREDRPLREEENPLLAAARTLVTGRQADAVLVVWPDLAADDGSGTKAGHVSVYFDSVREDSRAARDRVTDILEEYRAAARAERLQARQPPIPETLFTVFETLVRDVAPPARQAGFVLGSFLPFLLISLSLIGGFYPAVDPTAGEKERNTLQTLLCAPIRPAEIVAGKFLTVWCVALVAALANILSLGVSMARVVPAGQLDVPWTTFAAAAAMLIPVTLATTATFLAVAAFARDFKDGQNFLTPVYMGLALPSAVTMLPGIELNPWTAFVPVVNIALLIKTLLIGEAPGELIFLVLVGSAAYALLAVTLAVRVFQREQVLLGSRDSARGLFGLERRQGGVPSPVLAVSLFAVILVVAFYGSRLLEHQSIPVMLLVTQYGFFLAPALALVFGLGFGARETLSLARLSVAGAAAAVLVGLSAWAVVGGLVMRLAPPPDSVVRALQRLLMLGDEPMPLWMVLGVVALTPAICEELLFRGVILNGLRSLGKWPAIVVSSLLFAFAHASTYRLLPTLLLGLLLGYLVWQTGSILAGMIAHAINNGVAATLTQYPSVATRLGVSDTAVDWTVTVVALACTVAGVWFAWRLPPPVPHARHTTS